MMPIDTRPSEVIHSLLGAPALGLSPEGSRIPASPGELYPPPPTPLENSLWMLGFSRSLPLLPGKGAPDTRTTHWAWLPCVPASGTCVGPSGAPCRSHAHATEAQNRGSEGVSDPPGVVQLMTGKELGLQLDPAQLSGPTNSPLGKRGCGPPRLRALQGSPLLRRRDGAGMPTAQRLGKAWLRFLRFQSCRAESGARPETHQPSPPAVPGLAPRDQDPPPQRK